MVQAINYRRGGDRSTDIFKDAALAVSEAEGVVGFLCEKKRFLCYFGSLEIPLNPPLPKGDFNSPLRKRGVGGDFPRRVQFCNRDLL